MTGNVIELYEKKIDHIKDMDQKTRDSLKKKLKERYNQVKYEPGEAIGVVAAQSISEPATQTTLRSYHREAKAGLEVTQGLPRIIEIFDARKEPKTPSMKIYLADDHNEKDKAKEVAAVIKETTLKQIIEEDSLDFANMQIEIKLNPAQLESLSLAVEEIIKNLKKGIKNVNITAKDKNTIIIEPKKSNITVKDLQTIRIKARNLYIRGIKDITQAVVEKEKEKWVIHTLGSNLRKVMKVKGVDIYNTRTNNINEIQEVLGLEAARNAIVQELMETLKEQGVDTDIRHIQLVSDAMTSNGKIYAIGRYGLSGMKSSILAKANFEETVKHLINAAAEETVDTIDGVVENIIIGKTAQVGTGLVNIVMKTAKDK